MKRIINSSTVIDKIESKLMAPYKGYTVEKSWLVDAKGRVIKDSVLYAAVDDDDNWIGDMYKTVKEVHDYIDSIAKKEIKSSTRTIVKASHGFSEEHDRTGLHDFYDWYDSRPYTVQMKIDDMADDMGLPEYDECSTEDLDELRERYIASRKKK